MSSHSAGALWRTLGFPVRIPDGESRPRVVDTLDSVRDAVRLILLTSPGERQMNPAFGCRLRDILFGLYTEQAERIGEHHARDALERWEPRIEVRSVTIHRRGRDGGGVQSAEIEVVYAVPGLQRVVTDHIELERGEL